MPAVLNPIHTTATVYLWVDTSLFFSCLYVALMVTRNHLQLHISAGALLKISLPSATLLALDLCLCPHQSVQTQWLSTPLCCSHIAVMSLMLKDFVQVFINKCQGTIISFMDQIIESINGIIHPTTLEKYQIILTENLVLHMKISHNCNTSHLSIF